MNFQRRLLLPKWQQPGKIHVLAEDEYSPAEGQIACQEKLNSSALCNRVCHTLYSLGRTPGDCSGKVGKKNGTSAKKRALRFANITSEDNVEMSALTAVSATGAHLAKEVKE